ncbi:hypothetical protein MMU07_19655 [Aquiflexum sp. LQ15W]|uniref:hypothetical protein n=1 Tax=Cognataquiflexum nitidum TaxID=2922272 RepID=UPI001F12A721|nr:hypothetical protein [Cognataquiflexum nitidum]MCH6201805.1 hypothetical protein [Cognataquiflexum nitidum]
MTDQLIDFLKSKYGNRIDQPQPLEDLDNGAIQTQLDLVGKSISNSYTIGILWAIIGTIWLILSIISLVTDNVGILNISKVVLGFIYILLSYYYLHRSAELKKKEVILEKILFINRK